MKSVLITWGYKEYALQLGNALSSLSEITLIAPQQFKMHYEKNRSNDLHLQFFVYPRLRHPSNIIHMNKIIQKIEKIDPDVVHIQEGNPWFCFLLWRIKKYPLVNTIHDPKLHLGEEKIHEIFRDKVTKWYTDRYIVHGKFLKNQLHRTQNVALDKIDIVPHGNFEILAKKSKKKEDVPTILFFGRIWPYKGLEYLIRAEPLLRKKLDNFKIIIAGQGEDFDKYQELIENPKNFEIHNRFIEEEEIPQFFNRADIVVLPYIEASQSGVIPLAYAYEKPVVATSVGSIPEIVDDGETGLLVPPKDSTALSDALVKLLADKKLVEKLGKAGYKKSITDLSWDTIAKKTVKVYEKCLTD